MPQKNNPVNAELLVSLFEISSSKNALMTQALSHRQQRDGVAWTLEWHALPEICMASAKSLTLATKLAVRLLPNAEKMLCNLEGDHGLIYAEAISFKLAEVMPRPEAQAEVKRLCAEALSLQRRLPELVAEVYPGIDWEMLATPEQQFGDAVEQVRWFVGLVGQI